MLTNIRIVLVAPSHPGNIGSAARAMKTMGLRQLVLVNPKLFPHAKATELAAGADDVLMNATVVDSLDEALSGCTLAVATSARPRELELKLLDPKQVAQQILAEVQNNEQRGNLSDNNHVVTVIPAQAGIQGISPSSLDSRLRGNDTLNHQSGIEKLRGNVAIVFGREHAGLTNEELLKCQIHVMIPADSSYSSLNLAAAVQIICYELRMATLGNETLTTTQKDRFATVKELNYFYQHLETVLTARGFLKADAPKRIMPRLRRLFGRLRLENREVRLLRGILTMVEKY